MPDGKSSGFDKVIIKGDKAGTVCKDFGIPYKGGVITGDLARKQCTFLYISKK